ncbi:MAG: hypothetical protein ACI4TV_06320 [Paludibacteraceae bacterium]
MKKLYSLLLAFVAASFSFTANADPVTFKLYVEGLQHLTITNPPITFTDAAQTELQEGLQIVSYESTSYSYFSAAPASAEYGWEAYRWYHATINGKDSLVAGKLASSLYSSSFYLPNVQAGDSVVVKAWEIAAERTASCTVYIDDATKASFGYNSGAINLPSGKDTVITYAPKTDRVTDIPFAVRGNGVTIYEVTLDGVAQKDYNGNKSCYSYYITPVEGEPNKIVITTAFPDVQVAFNFTDEAGMVDSVYVNGVKDNDFRAASHTIPLGATVKLFFNTENFKLNSLTVDGSQPYVSGNYYEWQVVSESGTTVVVNATKYVEATITINVDVASNVKVWKSSQSGSFSSYYSEEIALEDGGNEVKIVLGKTPYLYVENANKSTILTFVDGAGNSYMDKLGSDPSNYGYAKSITLTDGMVFTITTQTFVRDRSCTLKVLNTSMLLYGGSVQLAGETIYGLSSDLDVTIPFAGSETFNFYFNGTKSNVYINNVLYANTDYMSNYAMPDGAEVVVYCGDTDADDWFEVEMMPSDDLMSNEEYADLYQSLQNELAITEVRDRWSTIIAAPIQVLPEGATLHVHVPAGIQLNVWDSENYSETPTEVITADAEGNCEVVVEDDLFVEFAVDNTSTAIVNTSALETATKVIRDGRVLIIRGEEMFDVLGNSIAQ